MAAFVITAGLTLGLSLLLRCVGRVEFRDTRHTSLHSTSANMSITRIRQILSPTMKRRVWSKMLAKLVLGFSDQQLVTGMGILIVAFM